MGFLLHRSARNRKTFSKCAPADNARHDKMVALVDRMLELNKQKHSSEPAPSQLETVEREIASTAGWRGPCGSAIHVFPRAFGAQTSKRDAPPAALSETIRLMAEIDAAIAKWPIG